MTEPPSTLPDMSAEKHHLLVNQFLCEIEERKKKFLEIEQKFLILEANVFSLANQLQKYKCEMYQSITESVVGEKFQSKEEEPADTLTLAEKLRESNIQIRDQAQELFHLRQKLRQGRNASILLSQHLKDLLTQDDTDGHQGQSLRDQLTEGCRLAECLVHKLSTEAEDNQKQEEGEEPAVPRKMTEVEESGEELMDSLDERSSVQSSCYEETDSHQSPRILDFLREEHIVYTVLDDAESKTNCKGEEIQEPRARRDQPEEEESEDELVDSLDEISSVHSSYHDGPDSPQPPSTLDCLCEEHFFWSVSYVAESNNKFQDEEREKPKAPRDLPEENKSDEEMVDSLDEIYLVHSDCHDKPESPQLPSTLDFLFEERCICTSLDVAKNKTDCQDEERQERKAPSCHDEFESSQQPSSTLAFQSEEHFICSSLDMAEKKPDCQYEERQEPKAPRNLLTVLVSREAVCGLSTKLLVRTSCHDRSNSPQSPSTLDFKCEEHFIHSLLDVTKSKTDCQDEERQEPKAPSMQKEEKSDEELVGSLDEIYLLHSNCHKDSEYPQPSSTLRFICEEHLICSVLHMAESNTDYQDKEIQKPKDPRALPEDTASEEELVDTWHEISLVHSSCHKESNSLQTLNTPDFEFVKDFICPDWDLANHCENKKYEEKEPQSQANDKDREFHFLSEVQVRELTRLRQKLKEKKDASCFLKQLLNDLLTQDGPGSLMGQDHRGRLAKAHRLAEHLARKLRPENLKDEDDDEQKLLESLAPRLSDFLVQGSVLEVTPQHQKLQEGRDASLSLHKHLKGLLTQEDSDRPQRQGYREQLTEGFRLAEHLMRNLSTENQDNKEDEDGELLDSSLKNELEEDTVNGLLADEQYFPHSGHPDPLDLQELLRGTTLLEEPKASSALDGSDACFEMKNPPQLEGDFLEGSDTNTSDLEVYDITEASSIPKRKIFKRKLQLSKYNIACQFPGFPASDLNVDTSLSMKNTPKLEGDSLEGFDTNIPDLEVHILTEASSIPKEIFKRHLQLSKNNIACRFPEPPASAVPSPPSPGCTTKTQTMKVYHWLSKSLQPCWVVSHKDGSFTYSIAECCSGSLKSTVNSAAIAASCS